MGSTVAIGAISIEMVLIVHEGLISGTGVISSDVASGGGGTAAVSFI